MDKQKVGLLTLGALAVYFVAAGGFAKLGGDMSLLEVLLQPLRRATAWDLLVLTVGAIAFAFAVLPNSADDPLPRASLWEGVALGSALLGTVAAVLLVSSSGKAASDTLGLLLLVGVGQAFVGLAASVLLLLHRESRRRSWLPLGLNTALAVVGSVALVAPHL